MKTNTQMQNYLRETSTEYPVELPEGLKAILDQGFVKVRGGIFFKAKEDQVPDEPWGPFQDWIGVEASVNKLQMDNFSRDNLLNIGLTFAWHVWKAHKQSGIKDDIKLLLGTDGISVNFRFYTFDPAVTWLNEDNLERVMGGVLIFTTVEQIPPLEEFKEAVIALPCGQPPS